MPVTKTETSGGGANMIVTISGGTATLSASVVGGTAPYTYLWSQAQNIGNIYGNVGGAMTQTQQPAVNSNDIDIVFSPADAFGSAVLWQCIATDSLGNKAVGYRLNILTT